MPTNIFCLLTKHAVVSRTLRHLTLCLPFVVLAACGGGGGGSSSTPAPPSSQTVDQLANICTPAGEKAWVFADLNDVYLFYRDIVPVDPNAYATPEDYFRALLVKSKDRFSFVESQATADAFFLAGQNLGYGGEYVFDTNSKLRIGFVEPAGPLAAQSVARGAEITALNGMAVTDLSRTQLNALLFPTATGVTLSFTITDVALGVPRTLAVASANVMQTPVPNVQILDAGGGVKVGYLLFNDHIATSENALIAAIARFRNAGINDLVLDIRYNGGGFLYIASELAQMIGGSGVAGKTFEKLLFSDKHPEKTNAPGNTVPFFTTSTVSETLPTLNLSRVFVLTGKGTCSASESIINGLSPFVQVIRTGGTTCGKPYGFIQKNNCAKAYFAIEFEGVNANGAGGYTSGFAPTCAAADDFDHPLGDPNERLLSTALAYRTSSACPAASSLQDALQGTRAPERVLRPADRERRLIR